MTSIELFFAYKAFSLMTGVFIVFLGYKLFVVGVYSEQSSDLKAAWGDKSVVLKRAAPGTLFSLFGAIVVSLAVFKGVSVETTQEQSLTPRGAEAISAHSEPTENKPNNAKEEASSKFDGLTKSNATLNLSQNVISATNIAFEKMRGGYTLTPDERDLVWRWINLDQYPETDNRTIPVFQQVSTYREHLTGSPAP